MEKSALRETLALWRREAGADEERIRVDARDKRGFEAMARDLGLSIEKVPS